MRNLVWCLVIVWRMFVGGWMLVRVKLLGCSSVGLKWVLCSCMLGSVMGSG